jgi:hypothetical protein
VGGACEGWNAATPAAAAAAAAAASKQTLVCWCLCGMHFLASSAHSQPFMWYLQRPMLMVGGWSQQGRSPTNRRSTPRE